jgi:predicted nuclease of predicted toxin-antitoxin system
MLPVYDPAMPRERSFEEWEQEQRERDPGWNRHIRDFEKARGPKRKVPLLLDENLEAEFVDDLRTVKDFRVTVGKPGIDDRALWDQARAMQAILVTTDGDFWDDRNFPLAQSPGVIIISGRSASEKTHTFAMAMVSWDVINTWRKVPGWLLGIKLRATQEDVRGKYWDGTSVVRV